jgi:hypothetical protein
VARTNELEGRGCKYPRPLNSYSEQVEGDEEMNEVTLRTRIATLVVAAMLAVLGAAMMAGTLAAEDALAADQVGVVDDLTMEVETGTYS